MPAAINATLRDESGPDCLTIGTKDSSHTAAFSRQLQQLEANTQLVVTTMQS